MKNVFFALLTLLTLAGSSQGFASGEFTLSESESNRVLGADIKLTKDFKVVASADASHKIESSVMEIQESENCVWNKVSDSVVQLGGRCEMLSGAYRYTFRTVAGIRHQVLVAFSVSRPYSEGRIFMVSTPLEVVEKD
jgi:hypothetical protein